MSYIPIRVISRRAHTLTESDDLSQAVSVFQKGDHYLVVERNLVHYTLSIGKILTLLPGIDHSKSIGEAFSPLLTDLFVQRYHDPRIPVLQESGLYAKRLAVFNPLAYGEYTVQFTSINTPEIVDDPTRMGFLDDLVIKGPYDMTHYLVAVNGVFHRTVMNDGHLYVLDGFRTIRISERKDIVVIDTAAIGGHTIVPLTPDNVTKSDYQSTCVVTAPMSLVGKTVLPVIDGYFYHQAQQVLQSISDTKLRLFTNKLLLTEQFRHNPRTLYKVDRFGQDAPQTSRKYVDAYEDVFLGKTSVRANSLLTAEFQYSRLTHYHSFLVVFNNPALFAVARELVYSDTPKFYSDFDKRPLSGMITHKCGLCPSYLIWKDSFQQSSVFLPFHDPDGDYHNRAIDPFVIPTLMDADPSLDIPSCFTQCIDYISS